MEGAECSDALGDTDVYGTPRILNGAIDIGAVEYDWRPAFAQAVGKNLTLTDVSPSVTTNAAGGLLIPSGAVAGTVVKGGKYVFAFTLSGGSLEEKAEKVRHLPPRNTIPQPDPVRDKGPDRG